MRRYWTYIVIGITMAVCGACHSRTATADMSDSEKLELLDLKLDKHPNDAKARYERAALLLSLHRTAEAAADIDRALAADPSNVTYLMLQGDISFAQGNVEQSYKALSEAERIEPNSQEVQLKMGELLFYSRDYDRALKCLSNVTAADPDNRTALFLKGYIYKEKGDSASAVQFYRKVCDRYPDYAPAFEELGIMYSERGNPLAVEYLQTAIRISPDNTNAMYALAMYYQDKGMMDAAEEMYRQIIEINPKSADSWHNLGYIELFHYKDYDSAVAYMTKAIDADPQHIAAYTNRGCAYELMNQPAKAAADFETALNIDNQYQPAIDGRNRISKNNQYKTFVI